MLLWMAGRKKKETVKQKKYGFEWVSPKYDYGFLDKPVKKHLKKILSFFWLNQHPR